MASTGDTDDLHQILRGSGGSSLRESQSHLLSPLTVSPAHSLSLTCSLPQSHLFSSPSVSPVQFSHSLTCSLPQSHLFSPLSLSFILCL